MKATATVFFGIFCLCVCAQSSDSLLIKFANSAEDTSKVLTLLDLYELHFESDQDLAAEYANDAYKMAHAIGFDRGLILSSNALGFISMKEGLLDSAEHYFDYALQTSQQISFAKGIIGSTRGKGDVLRELGQWKEAIEQYRRSIRVAESINDTFSISNRYNRIGNIFLDRSQFDSALVYYQSAAESSPNDKQIQASSIGNIGLVHYYLRDLGKANNYFLKSLDIAQSIDFKAGIAYGNQRIGLLKKSQGNFQEALEHYNKSVSLFRETGNRKGVVMLSQNIGNIYFELEDFDRAIEKYLESLAEAIEIADNINRSFVLASLGGAYFEKKEYAISEKYFLEAKMVSERHGVGLISMDAAYALRELYAVQGFYKKAYEYGRMHQAIRDSIFNEKNARQIAEMETRFETAQKEKEIDLLNAKSEIDTLLIQKRSAQRNSLIVIVMALFALALVLFGRYKTKEKANRKLKQIDDLKSRFITNISHEFRTPLTLILGPVESRLNENLTSEYKDELTSIKQNADRLLELVNQLLDLSRLEVGQMQLKVRERDFYKFLRQSVSSFESLAAQKNIKLTIDIPEDELNIYFDWDKCQKVVFNLLSNALKFTPEKGEVSVSVSKGGDTLKVYVQDSGLGIPKDQQENAFKRFHQLDETHSQRGAGVGLALVKELVNLHYGEISLESEEGKGTTFIFELPLSSDQYSELEILHDTELSVDSIDNPEDSTVLNEVSILIVEDNVDVRDYIANILSKSYKLMVAENGREGFELAHEFIPDLIVSDLMMNEMDGLEFCKRIREEEKTSHIPFIMVTAKADIDSKLEGLEMGIDEYLIKPFNERELKTRIKNLIAQRMKLKNSFEKFVTLEPSKLAITPPDEVFLKRAMDVIEEYMADSNFTVDQFQKEMAMSRMQLHRKLKALISCSASEFIRMQRLKRAKQILDTDGINVSEVAYQTGFSSLSYFSKCFKEEYGIPPSDYSANKANLSS